MSVKCLWEGCGTTFSSGQRVAQHLQKLHGESEELVCLWRGCCRYESSFQRRDMFRRHLASVHSKTKPFPCQVVGCIESFSREVQLQKHMKTSHATESGQQLPIDFQKLSEVEEIVLDESDEDTNQIIQQNSSHQMDDENSQNFCDASSSNFENFETNDENFEVLGTFEASVLKPDVSVSVDSSPNVSNSKFQEKFQVSPAVKIFEKSGRNFAKFSGTEMKTNLNLLYDFRRNLMDAMLYYDAKSIGLMHRSAPNCLWTILMEISSKVETNDSLPSDETVHLKPTRKSKNKPPPAQRIVLENALNTYGPYCKGKYHELALATGLSQHRIRVWFHSRRTWLKNKGILPRVATFTERMSDEDKDSLNQHYLSWIQDQSRYAQKAKKK